MTQRDDLALVSWDVVCWRPRAIPRQIYPIQQAIRTVEQARAQMEYYKQHFEAWKKQQR